ncbi:SurA N-terminal domain-containing protein [Streptacidiphilus sp. P02-A3a]|uniref:SurA N-terminal domain-containing protein n=1 Tax=Streptacidiphilus sp. P02-A3a TaxID=2704468 RepID=UPI0015FE7CB1|nr:SurA N-terminal domain-containing protein [Streptacidiphilus sp. P02-A3a]QMU72808.1 hypothetical protein GXP74_35720 [Streptacidiphilus sp. P02-A3a]
MNRRRRRTAVAVLAACGVAALSGCSAASEHPGAAAVVGNQRIAVSTLQADVSAYRAALAQDTNAQEGTAVSGQTLQLLVLAQVVQQTLAERGLSVTEGQVQQDEAADASQAGGAQALAQDFVQQLSLAPSSMDTYYRMRAGELELLQQAGVDPSATDAGAQLQKILTTAADQLKVTVNPRYGVWSDQKLTLGAPTEPWLKA